MVGEPATELVLGDGYVLFARPGWGTVEQLRLDAVEPAVEEVAELARARGLAYVNWWVGARPTPADLGERLLELGFEPDPELPLSKSLVLEHEPSGRATADVRVVTTADDYVRTREIAAAIWPNSKGTEAEWRAAWPALAASDRSRLYLACVDGEAAGFGRAVFTPDAGMLMGGAVLPGARGQGLYVALVHARWRDSVARGVPRLLVGAGPMSAPILERLGFVQIGETRVLRQRLGSVRGDDRS
jgi:GNAT superfamily N-acetyltransferase